jgi:hypothetical protein
MISTNKIADDIRFVLCARVIIVIIRIRIVIIIIIIIIIIFGHE